MFFSFLKGTLLYLFLISLISSIFSLIVNLLSHSNTCNNDDKTCAELWVNLFVRADSADSYLIEDILFDVTILVAIIYFFVYRNMQNNLQKFMNEKHMTEDDYTVLISNIPLIDFPKVG